MTPVAEPLAVDETLKEVLRAKLASAPKPLTIPEAAKGLKRPKKVSVTDFKDQIQQALEEEVRIGRAFRHPSGKQGQPRFWARDERQLLRDLAAESASTPQPLSALKTKLGKAVKGTDGTFVEAVVREMIGADQLYEHPAKTKKGGPLFGVFPSPPPLEQAKHQKALAKLVADCRKVMTATGAGWDELARVLGIQLAPVVEKSSQPAPPTAVPATDNLTDRTFGARTQAGPVSELDRLILSAVTNIPVISLAELRQEMPAEYQGRAFDEAVLRLADERRVFISQDVNPARFTAAERAAFVQDGDVVFTTISKWS